MEYQAVRRKFFDGRALKDRFRRLFELHHDFRATLPQTFARAQVNRHALPTPVVDIKFRRRKRLGIRFGIHALLFTIAGLQYITRVVEGGAILAAHHMLRHFLFIVDAHRLQGFGFLIANRIGFKRGRWLHAQISQHLEHVVLHHVAQHARGIVIPATPLHVDHFAHVELDVVDVILVPQRLEHAVGKTEGQQILHRLLAEIMIDAVDLLLIPMRQ